MGSHLGIVSSTNPPINYCFQKATYKHICQLVDDPMHNIQENKINLIQASNT